jgi:hypothetical protein
VEKYLQNKLVHNLPTKKLKAVEKFSGGSRVVTSHMKILRCNYLNIFSVFVMDHFSTQK